MTTIPPSRGRVAPVGPPGADIAVAPWRSHAALGRLLAALAGALQRRAGRDRALDGLSRETLLAQPRLGWHVPPARPDPNAMSDHLLRDLGLAGHRHRREAPGRLVPERIGPPC